MLAQVIDQFHWPTKREHWICKSLLYVPFLLLSETQCGGFYQGFYSKNNSTLLICLTSCPTHAKFCWHDMFVFNNLVKIEPVHLQHTTATEGVGRHCFIHLNACISLPLMDHHFFGLGCLFMFSCYELALEIELNRLKLVVSPVVSLAMLILSFSEA